MDFFGLFKTLMTINIIQNKEISMEYVTVNGVDYVHIQTLAEALNVCTATLYNWRRAGHITFEWPLGRVMSFVRRDTATRLMRLRVTEAMGSFARSMEKQDK
jgi:hypothetical protein